MDSRIVQTTQMKMAVLRLLLRHVRVQAVSSNAGMVRVYFKRGAVMVIKTAVITQMK